MFTVFFSFYLDEEMKGILVVHLVVWKRRPFPNQCEQHQCNFKGDSSMHNMCNAAIIMITDFVIQNLLLCHACDFLSWRFKHDNKASVHLQCTHGIVRTIVITFPLFGTAERPQDCWISETCLTYQVFLTFQILVDPDGMEIFKYLCYVEKPWAT